MILSSLTKICQNRPNNKLKFCENQLKKVDFRKNLDPIWNLVLKRVSKFVIPQFRDTLLVPKITKCEDLLQLLDSGRNKKCYFERSQKDMLRKTLRRKYKNLNYNNYILKLFNPTHFNYSISKTHLLKECNLNFLEYSHRK